MNLNDFLDFTDHSQTITKQAFSKARSKLSPHVFVDLNEGLIRDYYSDNEYSKWKGLRLIAIDGSDIQLPQQEQIKSEYGMSKNQKGNAIAMAKASYAYDVLNKLTLDVKLDRFKTSERELAIKHIQAIETTKERDVKDLYIFNRGYPSLGLIFYLAKLKKDFVMRSSTVSCFSEIKEAFDKGEEDVIIRLYAKNAHARQIKELRKRIPDLDRKNVYVDIRLTIITLKTGEKEFLISSLIDKKTYKQEDLRFIYREVEENLKFHKVALELENFSGYSKEAIEQDFFSLVFTANIASILIREAEEELREENGEKDLKYTYEINKRIAMGTLRNQLVNVLWNDEAEVEVFCEGIKKRIKKYMYPVRKDRKYERNWKAARKYGCTLRRCI